MENWKYREIIHILLVISRSMFPIFLENRKSIQKFLSGNPPDFNFYLRKLTNKNFPHMVQC